MIERILKYVAIAAVALGLVFFVSKIHSCTSSGVSPQPTYVPRDSNFVPVARQDYQPPSLPFSKRKLDVKLPAGLKEKDISRVIAIGVGNIAGDSTRTFNIIETKGGDVFLQRDSSVRSLTVTRVTPAILDFGIRFGFGISAAGFKDPAFIRPALALAPLEWSGWLQTPTIIADLDGVGVGAQARLYHDFYLGAGRLWLYDGGAKIKATLHLML